MMIFEKFPFLSKAMKFTQRSTPLSFFGGLWNAFGLNFLDIWSMAFAWCSFWRPLLAPTLDMGLRSVKIQLKCLILDQNDNQVP